MEVVPSSSSPFGRVLKDHNLSRPPTTASNLQKTLQELVREHLRSSISTCNENSIKSPNNGKSSSVSCLVQKWSCNDQAQNQELVAAIRNNSQESDNDSISDYESDQAPVENNKIKIGNVMKKEKIRVVDIMRKLKSPRIRGRQAVSDLLARLTRDRYDEVEALARCQVVSTFAKRGRIQSLLRYKLLRGEWSENDQRQQQAPKAREFCKSIQQRLSSVNSLRRRFSRGQIELNDLDYTVEEKASELSQPLISAEEAKDNHQEEINLCLISDENVEAIVEQQEEESFDTPRSSAFTETVMEDTALEEAEDPPQESGTDEEANYEKTDTISQNVWEEEEYEEEIVENEEYYDDNDFFESSLDWIHDISRPHSYWEGRRKAWYQEIFESSTNNDIRRLIERGSVSAVLASDFRDRMDQLMVSNVQLQMHSIDSTDNEGRSRSRVAFLQTQMRSLSGSLVEDEEEQNQDHEHHHQQQEAIVEEPVDENREMEGEDEDYNHEQTPLEEEDEDYNNVETPLEEEDDDYDNEQAPLMELPWSSYQEQEEDGGDDSEQIESETHRQESFVTNSYDRDSQVGSSTKNSSTIEMELISDIRTHMQQMYSEMSELRKAVNGCMEMQSKMQFSIREEVSAAMNHIKGKESKRKASKKGSCRVCHKKKADALLYRCGHMCTCYECAHELQWSSGKCPICWAEIVDVVRVCTDYY